MLSRFHLVPECNGRTDGPRPEQRFIDLPQFIHIH